MSTPTFADLLATKTAEQNKSDLYQKLAAAGFSGVYSWATTSVPSALIETEKDSLTELQATRAAITRGGFNSLAKDGALSILSREVYANDRDQGNKLVGSLRLTDAAGIGPITIDATKLSTGIGSLIYKGISEPTSGVQVYVLPLNGSVRILFQAENVGVKYNVAPGTLTTLTRGAIPGVDITNPSDWLSLADTSAGRDVEQDVSLQKKNATQWGTLSAGATQAAYERWARGASQEVTRVSVLTNVDIFDPGTVTVIIAGASGAVGSDVVMAVQNAIAANQIGGPKIPGTARAVVVSASNLPVMVSGTLFIDAAANTLAFQQQIAQAVSDYQAALDIGGYVDAERLLGVVVSPAGTSPNYVKKVSNFLPSTDIQPAYYQTPVFNLSGLNYVSV